MIPAHVYSDPDVFELERERLFARAWVFLAHESEVPSPGDYVVRRIVDDSFIVVRDEAGVVRVHFNMCLHRGMQVCRAELGNASHFRCPYHGWSYRNDGRLAGLPFHQDAYGGDDGLRARPSTTCCRPPRVDTIDGMVFASLAADGPSLREHLGDFAFYLGFYTRQSAAGLELRGPQRWRVRANWKIGCENFVGDMYHTPHTHRSVVDIGLFREPKAHKRKEGALYFAGAGGGTTYKLPAGRLRRAHALRRLPRRDDRAGRARRGRPTQVAMVGRRRLHGLGGDAVPEPQLRAQLAAGRRRRHGRAVHLDPPVAAGVVDRDRGAVVVRRRPRRAGGVQARLLPGLPDVLRLVGHVRAGRRRELGVDHQGVAGRDGPPAAPQQPHGADVRRRGDQPAACPASPGPASARVGYSEFNQRDWLTMWSSHLAGGPVERTHPLGPAMT